MKLPEKRQETPSPGFQSRRATPHVMDDTMANDLETGTEQDQG